LDPSPCSIFISKYRRFFRYIACSSVKFEVMLENLAVREKFSVILRTVNLFG
jgi:hypothetical protein